MSQEQAIQSAREFMLRIPPDVAWVEKAKVEAYLQGDIWTVLFWEEGSKDNRFRVSVNAVTGAATGASQG